MPSVRTSSVPESVVQDVWAGQLFDTRHLSTTDGKPIRVVNPGRKNSDAGPDFLAAQISVDKLRWFGDIEIHVASSTWYEHNHDKDPRYNNVILHVVLEQDFWTGKVRRQDGSLIPEIVLHPHLTVPINRLMFAIASANQHAIVCGPSIANVPSDVTDRWVLRLGRRRIEQKMDKLASASTDRLDAFRRALVRALGYSKNADAMERLYSLTAPHLKRLKGKLEYEAFLLGVADLLPKRNILMSMSPEHRDHAISLYAAFDRLTTLLNPDRMSRPEWRFFRLRPASFPHIRVAQASALLYRIDSEPGSYSFAGFQDVLKGSNPSGPLRDLFRIELSGFYASRRRNRQSTIRGPGDARIDRLLVNAVAPFVLLEAGLTGDEATALSMLKILSQLPAEDDEVTRLYRDYGLTNPNAYFSQGMHELYRQYCIKKHCLKCEIGSYLLANGSQNIGSPVTPYADSNREDDFPRGAP